MSLAIQPALKWNLYSGRLPVKKSGNLSRTKLSKVNLEAISSQKTNFLPQLRKNILNWIKSNPDKSYAYIKYMTASPFIYAGLNSSGIVSKAAYARGALDVVEGLAVQIIGKKRIISFAKRIIEDMRMINLATTKSVIPCDKSALHCALLPLRIATKT